MTVETSGKQGLRQGHLLLAGALMLLSLAALSAWHSMPIYPDEIAFRLQMGRYIQDQGVVHGLYPLCASNVKETPLLFVIPAWILSWLDLALSPVETRILPFATVLGATFFAVWYAVRRGINPNAAAVATTAFIGVAGSGLIMARYEYVQALNIVCCLGAFRFLESVSPRPSLRYGLFALLLTSGLLSIYAHVQGLLFLPLTLYLAYYVVYPGLGKLRAALIMGTLLVFIAQTAIRFHHSTCAGYPEIEQFWGRMTFNPGEFESVTWIDWLTVKTNKYLLSFLYEGKYAVNYLPGINVGKSWQQIFLLALNQCIQIILLVNLLLSLFVAIGASFFAVRRYVARRQLRATGETRKLAHEQALALVLLELPVIFLFLYDSAQNFYRSFFLNFVMAILLTMFLSRVSLARVRAPATLYFGLCGIVVLASLAMNVWWFTDRLSAGYEGPSLSLSRDWGEIGRDVEDLAQTCNMDLRKGRIVVDDMTYDSLKRYPLLYPATYMGLSTGITKLTMGDVINKLRPNYAVARCGTLRATSIEFQKSKNQLCCANFLNAQPTK